VPKEDEKIVHLLVNLFLLDYYEDGEKVLILWLN
jgi:hypothetical protein